MTAATMNAKDEAKSMGRRTMMRAAAGLFGALAIGSLATGCSMVAGERRMNVGNGPSIFGSGKSATREYKLANFTAIDVGSAFKVDVTQAADYAVSVTADDNLLDQVDVSVDGETLRIMMKPGSFLNAGYRATVTLPALKRLALSGASTAKLTGVDTRDRLDVRLSGASKLEGQATVTSLMLDISGASRATLTGAASTANLEISGASHATLDDLPMDDVRASLSGASQVVVHATKKLDVNLSGASKLTYAGQPTVSSQSVTGASTLARK